MTRSEPIPGPDEGGRITSPTLVGREEAAITLRETLGRRPSVILVEGEAGVGKSRLVAEVLGAPPAPTVLAAACYPLREPLPLAPILDAVRARPELVDAASLSPLAGSLRPLLPELADRLPPTPASLDDPAGERLRAFRALIELLASLGPCVLLIEDAHWADESTLDLLRMLVPQLPPELALVVTCRVESGTRRPEVLAILARPPAPVTFARISLAPLPPSDVASLVGAILGSGTVSEEFAEFIHERTAGIPFAIEEVLGLLRDRREIVRDEHRWMRRSVDSLQVPRAVRDSVLERMENVSPAAQAVARAAAVLGMPATEEHLGAVANLGADEAREALSAALSAALLRETGGRYDFRHALARQAVYEEIAGPERRAMHARAAESIDPADETTLGRLALHCREAGRVSDWVQRAQEAAAVASRLGNHHAAAAFYRDALTAPGITSEEKGSLANALCYESLNAVEHEPAVETLNKVLQDRTLTAADRGKIHMGLAVLRAQRGDIESARAEWKRSVAEFEARPGAASSALMNLALPFGDDASLDEHLQWLERAGVAVKRSSDPIMHASFPIDRIFLRMLIGELGAWDELLALPPSDEVEVVRERARGFSNLASACLTLGMLDRAGEAIARAEALTRSVPYRRIATSLATAQLRLDWHQGRWDGLEARARAIEQEWTARATARPSVLFSLGSLAAAAGRLDEADAMLREAGEIAARAGLRPTSSYIAGARMRLALDRGDAARAWSAGSADLAVMQRKGIWSWAGGCLEEAADTLVALGEHARAQEVAAAAGAGLAGREAPAAHAALAGARGVLAASEGDAAAAARAFEQAIAAWEAIGDPHRAARAREVAGRSLCDAGADGAPHLLRALEGFAALDATGDVARVRRTLRRFGVSLPHPWRGGRRGYGLALSPREEEVAALAAGGYTNREIARTLFLSHNTVAHHLASAMRKIGVSSRRALADKLEPGKMARPRP